MDNAVLINIPLGRNYNPPSQLDRIRKQYKSWRQHTKESKILLATLFALCEGKCPLCGKNMVLAFDGNCSDVANSATLDHITPLSKVLEHKKYGLQIMCKCCNSLKGNRDDN